MAFMWQSQRLVERLMGCFALGLGLSQDFFLDVGIFFPFLIFALHSVGAYGVLMSIRVKKVKRKSFINIVYCNSVSIRYCGKRRTWTPATRTTRRR